MSPRHTHAAVSRANGVPDRAPPNSSLMKMLVAGQFLTAALLVVRAGPDVTECPACIVGAVLAAALGLSAVMTLRRSLRILPGPAANAELRTTGPYRWVRHPMYLALLIFCAWQLSPTRRFFHGQSGDSCSPSC